MKKLHIRPARSAPAAILRWSVVGVVFSLLVAIFWNIFLDDSETDIVANFMVFALALLGWIPTAFILLKVSFILTAGPIPKHSKLAVFKSSRKGKSATFLRRSVVSIALIAFVIVLIGAFFESPKLTIGTKLMRFGLFMMVYVPVTSFVLYVIFGITSPYLRVYTPSDHEDYLWNRFWNPIPEFEESTSFYTTDPEDSMYVWNDF